jgi:hypothetical protein
MSTTLQKHHLSAKGRNIGRRNEKFNNITESKNLYNKSQISPDT